jgi:cytochrome c
MTNHWVHLLVPDGDDRQPAARGSKSRATSSIWPARLLITVPDERVVMWHVGGGTDFDSGQPLHRPRRQLESSNRAATRRTTSARRSVYDSQRSAATAKTSRQDLRIKPKDDGTYSIPAGNMFTDGSGLPEIYVMGDRNRSGSRSTRAPTGSTGARSAPTPPRTPTR